MHDVMAAIRQPRGHVEATSNDNRRVHLGEDSDDSTSVLAVDTPVKRAARQSFEKLFDVLMSAPKEARNNRLAFDLAKFVCVTLKPDSSIVKKYLNRIVESFAGSSITAEDRDTAVAAILVWSTQFEADNVSMITSARRKLLRVFAAFTGSMPDISIAQGFADLLVQRTEAKDLWDRICAVRTAQEQVRDYRLTTEVRPLKSAFPLLSTHSEWEILAERNNGRVKFLDRFKDYCPHCHLKLSAHEAQRLQSDAVTDHCCGRIILCEEF